jgi:hypothetical protein
LLFLLYLLTSLQKRLVVREREMRVEKFGIFLRDRNNLDMIIHDPLVERRVLLQHIDIPLCLVHLLKTSDLQCHMIFAKVGQ